MRRNLKQTEANYKRLIHRELEEKLQKGLQQRNNINKEEIQPPQEEQSTDEATEKVLVFFLFDSFALLSLKFKLQNKRVGTI